MWIVPLVSLLLPSRLKFARSDERRFLCAATDARPRWLARIVQPHPSGQQRHSCKQGDILGRARTKLGFNPCWRAEVMGWCPVRKQRLQERCAACENIHRRSAVDPSLQVRQAAHRKQGQPKQPQGAAGGAKSFFFVRRVPEMPKVVAGGNLLDQVRNSRERCAPLH